MADEMSTEPTPENLRKIAHAMTVHGTGSVHAIECLGTAADRIEELEAALSGLTFGLSEAYIRRTVMSRDRLRVAHQRAVDLLAASPDTPETQP